MDQWRPGAGKSTLMKLIHGLDKPVQCIGSSRGTGPASLLSFFFSELGIPTERTFLGLLHCLLSQLLVAMPEAIPSIQSRYRKLLLRSGGGTGRSSIWTESELQGAFDDIIRAQKRDTSSFCIIDRLDECEESKIHETLGFLRRLAELPATSPLRFKVLCSSRPETAVEMRLSKYPFFKIQDYTSSDIRKFVTETFATISENAYSDDPVLNIVGDLVTEIVEKSEGVFIWARLVVAETVFAIEAGDMTAQECFLNEFPLGLEELYNRIICKIPKQYLHQTINYLQILRHTMCCNLLGMTVAVHLPNEPLLCSQEMSSLTDQSKIASCIATKRVLQSRCRGLVALPVLNHQWTFEQHGREIMASFCMGEISIHRTVHEFIFAEERLAKFCAQMNAALLDDTEIQAVAFYFRLWHCDPVFQVQVLGCTSQEE